MQVTLAELEKFHSRHLLGDAKGKINFSTVDDNNNTDGDANGYGSVDDDDVAGKSTTSVEFSQASQFGEHICHVQDAIDASSLDADSSRSTDIAATDTVFQVTDLINDHYNLKAASQNALTEAQVAYLKFRRLHRKNFEETELKRFAYKQVQQQKTDHPDNNLSKQSEEDEILDY